MSYTDFKEISSPTSGTGTRYGSAQILEIMQLFNNKVVANRRAKITNEWIWSNHFDMTEVSAPANPDAGNQRIFIDSADHHLKLKNSSGTVTDIQAAVGGGNVSTTQANTYGDYDQTFRSGRLDVRNPANTFSYSITGAAIAAARALTLPLLTADDTVVCEAFTQTITNKTVNATNNTITDTSTAAGDLLKSNGTKFVRLARGTGLQVLRTNSGATDLEWASLDSERIGKSTASGNGSTTVFNIAHGIGSNPTYALISVADSGSTNIAYSYTTDATNIVVTFSSAPSSGASNVIIYWIAVA